MDSSAYLPVVLQSLVAIGFVVFVLVVTHILGPNRTSNVALNRKVMPVFRFPLNIL
jgi:NADH:ubiquinone oxidoreductase subunit 3 (subunit A)